MVKTAAVCSVRYICRKSKPTLKTVDADDHKVVEYRQWKGRGDTPHAV